MQNHITAPIQATRRFHSFERSRENVRIGYCFGRSGKMRGLATPSGWESGAGSVGRCASFGVPTPCSDRTPRSRKHLIFKGCHKSHVLSSILKPLASTRQIINKLSVRTLSNHSVRTILFRSTTERTTATSCTQQQVPSQPHRPAGARRNSRRTPHRAQPPRPTPRSIITTDIVTTSLTKILSKER